MNLYRLLTTTLMPKDWVMHLSLNRACRNSDGRRIVLLIGDTLTADATEVLLIKWITRLRLSVMLTYRLIAGGQRYGCQRWMNGRSLQGRAHELCTSGGMIYHK